MKVWRIDRGGVDAEPVFEPAEDVLDFLVMPIEIDVVRNAGLAIGFLRDAGRDLAVREGFPKPVDVVTFVTEDGLGLREGVIISAAPL